MNTPEKPELLFDDPSLVEKVTITAFKTPNGAVILDERSARYFACTHVKCEKCGVIIDKGWLKCRACRDWADYERYAKAERKVWDEESLLYSESMDEYIDGDQLHDLIADGSDAKSLMLWICEPVMARELTSEWWDGQLPGEEQETPDWLEALIDEFNEKLKGNPELSWTQSKYAAIVNL